jgi:hypothetical protein
MKLDPSRDLTNAAYQASSFAIALERMNALESNRRRKRLLKVIAMSLIGLSFLWVML